MGKERVAGHKTCSETGLATLTGDGGGSSSLTSQEPIMLPCPCPQPLPILHHMHWGGWGGLAETQLCVCVGGV